VRLWSLHPQYLDRAGLTAAWREGLLAQKVLQGGTRGYTHHPQLQRFHAHPDPEAAIAAYLRELVHDATRRGYRFDASKIPIDRGPIALQVNSGQLTYEWKHLMAKLQRRAPDLALLHAASPSPRAHPIFRVIDGPIAEWERP
jgi:hypothetical protein